MTQQMEIKEPQRLRGQEMDWLRSRPKELAQYAGQWIAIAGEQVLAAGDDPETVLQEARKAVENPMLFKVRRKRETVVACL